MSGTASPDSRHRLRPPSGGPGDVSPTRTFGSDTDHYQEPRSVTLNRSLPPPGSQHPLPPPRSATLNRQVSRLRPADEVIAGETPYHHTGTLGRQLSNGVVMAHDNQILGNVNPTITNIETTSTSEDTYENLPTHR